MIHGRSSAGDTIVEVLIAMAVASLVIGAAYAVTNHTLANTRQAQEHGEALGIAEGQVEQLKAVYKPSFKITWSGGTPFCIDTNTNLAVAASNPACAKPGGNGSYDYQIKIVYSNTENNFTAGVTWPSATGSGTDSVSQAYKVLGQ